jgi:hypothetical protein
LLLPRRVDLAAIEFPTFFEIGRMSFAPAIVLNESSAFALPGLRRDPKTSASTFLAFTALFVGGEPINPIR